MMPEDQREFRVESKTAKLLSKANADGDLRLARAHEVWASLPLEAQRLLTRELVESRTEELRAAYPSVRQVAYGYRTVTSEGSRGILREPCVGLMVGRKWKKPPKTAAALSKAVPEFLFAHAPFEGEGPRELCAVPTDVESSSEYFIRPQVLAREMIEVVDPGGQVPKQTGVLTCFVRIPGNPAKYALSCHHVLAMSNTLVNPGRPVQRARVQLVSGEEIGTRISIGGRLVPSNLGASFDMALSQIDYPVNAMKALGHVPLAGLWSANNPPDRALVERPRGAIVLTYVRTWRNFSQIGYNIGPPLPVQASVVEWQAQGTKTLGGDSGSPVLASDGTLVGMHLAGTASGKTFMLSAKQLLWGPNIGIAGELELIL